MFLNFHFFLTYIHFALLLRCGISVLIRIQSWDFLFTPPSPLPFEVASKVV